MMENVKDKINKACHLLSREAKELYLSEKIMEIDANNESLNALDFYRNNVSKNVPLLIKNGVKKWPAFEKWNINYFREKMNEKVVRVAVTPTGYADAIHEDNLSGNKFFTMPEERDMKMSLFLDNLEKTSSNNEEVCYIQQQNSNFQTDYYELWRDVDQNFAWANEAFNQEPDAINFWMGDQRAVTSMHKDPYENIYCVISGEKKFILHPPTDLPWIPYEKYPPAHYKKVENSWKIVPDDDKSHIPWIAVDPLNPDYEKYGKYRNATRIEVTVQAGDVLYLPSLWFHHVQQSHGCIAVNYWYDMAYDIKYAYFKALESLSE